MLVLCDALYHYGVMLRRKMMRTDHGSAHVAVAVILVFLLIGALAWVFLTNLSFVQRNTHNTDKTAGSQTDKAQDYEIIVGLGEFNTYKNNELGFSFDFPKTILGTVDCEALDDRHSAKIGDTAMTVLSSSNRFTIAQKRMPYVDNGDLLRQCEVKQATQQLLDSNAYLTHSLSWQVYRLDDESEISKIRKDLDGVVPHADGQRVLSVNYTLGPLEGKRKSVLFGAEYADGVVPTSSGAQLTWYYPEQRLLVHVSIGQEAVFPRANSTSDGYDDKYYGSMTDSFKVL